MRVVWTPLARTDALEYAALIAADNPHAAAQWLEAATAKAEQLGRFPALGRVVPEFGRNELREVFVGTHRMVYRAVGKTVQIIRLWHGSRLLGEDELAAGT